MSYPKDQLRSGESILAEEKKHWITFKMEILYTLVYLLLFWLVVPVWNPESFGIDTWIAWLLFLVWAGLVGKAIADWWSIDLVVTTQRVIYRQGVLTKAGYEIPIDRVQDVGFRQGLLQRMVGAGDLLVQTSASEGETAIRDISDPQHLKRLIVDTRYGTAAGTPTQPAAPPAPPASPGKSTAEQLEILADLHARGSLSDAEFEAEKAKLLSS